MQRTVEDEFRCVDGIGDDDYFGNVILITGLVDSTSHGE